MNAITQRLSDAKSVQDLAQMLRLELENVYRLLGPTQSTVGGVFKSSDSPAKTITVVNGIVTSVK